MTTPTTKMNLLAYVEEVRPLLLPPVSNKLLFSGEQMKVMVVAGPNERNDFHVELGDELFYMLIGDMDLGASPCAACSPLARHVTSQPHLVPTASHAVMPDVMENGVRTRIPIKEGSFFLLPAGIPHSPQVRLTVVQHVRTTSF